MQIGPSLSVLQALGSHPGAPEPARMKPGADAEAAAEVQRVAGRPEPQTPGEVAARALESASAASSGPGHRLDIVV